MSQTAAAEIVIQFAQELLKDQKYAPRLDANGAIILGISGPQGSGKTTASTQAASILTGLGIPTLAISLDDFYLRYTTQQKLVTRGNYFLSGRGPPGTHDVRLLQFTLESLKHGRLTEVPVYDKSLHNGKGDRAADLPLTGPRPKIVLIEGWSLGFQPRLETEIEDVVQQNKHRGWARPDELKSYYEVNKLLEQYKPAWSMIDALVYIKAESLEFIYEWRLQQEQELIKTKGHGMSDKEVEEFVDRFMPFYYLYSPLIRPDRELVLDAQRKIVKG